MIRRVFILCSALVLLILITPAQAVNTDPVEPIGACYNSCWKMTITQPDGSSQNFYHCVVGSGAFVGRKDCDASSEGCEMGGPLCYQQIA